MSFVTKLQLKEIIQKELTSYLLKEIDASRLSAAGVAPYKPPKKRDPCENVECPEGYECQQGECVDLEYGEKIRTLRGGGLGARGQFDPGPGDMDNPEERGALGPGYQDFHDQQTDAYTSLAGLEAGTPAMSKAVGGGTRAGPMMRNLALKKVATTGAQALGIGVAAAAAPVELAVGSMETEVPWTKWLDADYAGRAAKYSSSKIKDSVIGWRKQLLRRKKDRKLNTLKALEKDLARLKGWMEKDEETGRVSIRGFGGDYEQGYDKPVMNSQLADVIKMNYVDVMKKLTRARAGKQPKKLPPDVKRKLIAQAKKLGISPRQDMMNFQR